MKAADVVPAADESIPRAGKVPPPIDQTRSELKRGAVLNTLATVAANSRAVFTILIARLLGPIPLGVFSVAWAAVDLISKIGIVGLDDGITTFVARANAVHDTARCRAYFRGAAIVAVLQSAVVATLAAIGVRWWGSRLSLDPQMLSATAVLGFALPGIALYRISTCVSRGMKVMQHDIYSRGFTESGITIVAFLAAFAVGARLFAPEIAAIFGSFASGGVAFFFANRLFRNLAIDRPTSLSDIRPLLAYSLPIGADQLLNAFIWRIDLISLGILVDRVPGVTLTSLGIYGAVVGIANGLRKVSQSFIPIFTPVVAGMTATGEHERARQTYAQLAEWMLWILLPFVSVLALAGNTILLVFGRAFQNGATWLTIVAVACATNAFINLGETVIMVQRPRLNLLNSIITAGAGTFVTVVLILQFGVIGAAAGMLLTYLIQGAGRNVILRIVFHWRSSWNAISRPVILTGIALVPAAVLRLMLPEPAADIVSGAVYLLIFGCFWLRFRDREATS